jgi:thiamine biosynthesis protein ThiI
MRHLLLVKYGEVGLKGKNRPHFEQSLVRNVALALRRADRDGPGLTVRHLRGRLFADLGTEPDEARVSRLAESAARVFGVVGVAPACQVSLSLEAITEAAIRFAREAVEARARTFKLEVRRPNKAFPLPSPQVAAAVGRSVLDSVPGLTVDVHEPDLRIAVEIREEGAYLYGREIRGPGGLPLGISGRAVALISGGIDSPVATWMAMKRGLTAILLHFWSFPFTGEKARQKVIDLGRVLGGWGPLPGLIVCPFTEIQTAIRDACPEALQVTIMRRMMMRVAQRVALTEGAQAIVTGESLGQVASQTLESLAVIEAATALPVLRPLIGLDKDEIIARARAIGTYEISILPYEDCCTIFVPSRPRIKPTAPEVEDAERDLDLDGLVTRAVGGLDWMKLSD